MHRPILLARSPAVPWTVERWNIELTESNKTAHEGAEEHVDIRYRRVAALKCVNFEFFQSNGSIEDHFAKNRIIPGRAFRAARRVWFVAMGTRFLSTHLNRLVPRIDASVINGQRIGSFLVSGDIWLAVPLAGGRTIGGGKKGWTVNGGRNQSR